MLLFFTKFWKEIIIALVVIGAIWYVNNLQSTVKSQAETIIGQKIANDVLVQSNKVLTDTVTANNTTIAELGKSATDTKEKFGKLNLQIDSQSRELAKRLKVILNKPAPVTCSDTIDYLIEATPTYKGAAQ